MVKTRKKKNARIDDERLEGAPDNEHTPANPLTIAVGAVALITLGAIVVNATMLQPGRHPAPLFPQSLLTRTANPITGSTSPRKEVPKSRQLPKNAGRGDRALVADLQRVLRDRGRYTGQINGRADKQTLDAIKKFQRDSGLHADGRVSVDLLARLQMSASVGYPMPRPSPKRLPAPDRPAKSPMLTHVQKALSDLGYGPLRADGVMGDETAGAIRRFELDRGLMITGQVSRPLVHELVRIGGLSTN